jgi:hypothetical protein
VIRDVQEKGITDTELEQLKVKWRSDYFATLEGGRGGYMPKYGLMHLLACFTLFDGEPQLVNSILDGFLAVTKTRCRTSRAVISSWKIARLSFASRTLFRRRPRNGHASLPRRIRRS